MGEARWIVRPPRMTLGKAIEDRPTGAREARKSSMLARRMSAKAIDERGLAVQVTPES